MDGLRVLLAESHPLLRPAVGEVVVGIGGAQIVSEVEDAQQVVPIASHVMPDVILLDMSLPGSNGLEITRLIKKDLSHVQVVILIDEEHERYRKAAEQSGALADEEPGDRGPACSTGKTATG